MFCLVSSSPWLRCRSRPALAASCRCRRPSVQERRRRCQSHRRRRRQRSFCVLAGGAMLPVLRLPRLPPPQLQSPFRRPPTRWLALALRSAALGRVSSPGRGSLEERKKEAGERRERWPSRRRRWRRKEGNAPLFSRCCRSTPRLGLVLELPHVWYHSVKLPSSESK